MSDVPQPPLLPENVQAYPRPPALEPVPQRLRVLLSGTVVADTVRGLRVLETHHAPTYYFPPEDVLPGVLVPASGRSFCEWKGAATYFDLVAKGVTSHRAAWAYPTPDARYGALKDHVAFYPERVELALVGDVAAIPQPGSFYGGWVTPNLQGTIKGCAATRHW